MKKSEKFFLQFLSKKGRIEKQTKKQMKDFFLHFAGYTLEIFISAIMCIILVALIVFDVYLFSVDRYIVGSGILLLIFVFMGLVTTIMKYNF